MMSRTECWRRTAVLCVAALLAGGQARAADTDPASMPPGFPLLKATPETFGAAAKEEGGVVAVAVMRGTWGEQTDESKAWSDPRVRAWIAEHGKAFHYDPEYTIKPELLVEELEPLHYGVAMFRGGKLIDQDARFEKADELLEWLRVAGETGMTREYALKRAGEREAFRMWPRMVLAERLFRLGDERGADAELAWILCEMIRRENEQLKGPFESPEQAMGLVDSYTSPLFNWRSRGTAFIAKDPEAGKDFAALRRGLWEAAVREPENRFATGRWFRASMVLPDAEEFAAMVKLTEQGKDGKDNAEKMVESLCNELVRQGRWREAGTVLINPHRQLKLIEGKLGISEALAKMEDDPERKRQWAEGIGFQREYFARDAANLYTALLAADRDEEAVRLAEAAFKVWPSVECRRIVIERALEAGEARQHQVGWAAEVDREREGLAEKVRRSLPAEREKAR